MESFTSIKSFYEELKALMTSQHLILLLSFLFAANIVLSLGYSVTVPFVSWVQLKEIPIGASLLFFCAFGIYASWCSTLIRSFLFLLFGDVIPKIHNWFTNMSSSRIGRNDSPRFVMPHEIRERADRDSDPYYRSLYQEYEEGLSADLQLSSYAIGCIVLCVADVLSDGSKSLIMFACSKFEPRVALILGAVICFVLFSAALLPLTSDYSRIYCPGFPQTPNDLNGWEASDER